MNAPVLSFTTDYGCRDGFVAACHGVARTRAPHMPIIDVTHQVPPGDVRRGATVLAQTVPYLPTGIHVIVIDPGVGTTRHAVAVEAADGAGIVIGPDNGTLIPPVEALGGAVRATTLTNSALHCHPTSHTFHGRDIFTPVAAALACGVAFEELGEPIAVDTLVRLPETLVETDDTGITSEILAVDHFGNIQLAAPGALLAGYDEHWIVAGMRAVRADMFAAAKPGELVVLEDSAQHIAIAVNGGSAATALQVETGDTLRLECQ